MRGRREGKKRDLWNKVGAIVLIFGTKERLSAPKPRWSLFLHFTLQSNMSESDILSHDLFDFIKFCGKNDAVCKVHLWICNTVE